MASQQVMISGGPRSCSGSLQISGSKNAALPEFAACLLTNKEVTLKNVPDISDIREMKVQLKSYGVTINDSRSEQKLQATTNFTSHSPSSRAGSKTRGSFLVLGPLLARFRKATVYQPGGCQIVQGGERPVDFHINALEKMGAKVSTCGDEIVLQANQGLRGAYIDFPKISVGATENTVMAACLAEGQTVITKAAMEPEVMHLVDMLKKMGANIAVYTNENKIIVNGSRGLLLNGCTHTVIPDRIEAGTWAIAAAMTGGNLLLKMNPEIGKSIMKTVIEKLKKAGVTAEWQYNGLAVQRFGPINPVDITTGPYPDFPTDLLPQWVSFMTLATGPSSIKDTIYDNRFSHVPHLKSMGASFSPYSEKHYKVHGGANLKGTHVVATDLRAGAALILAALTASGSTVVKEFQHVLRGYEKIKEKLRANWGVTIRDLPETRPGFHGGRQEQAINNSFCCLL